MNTCRPFISENVASCQIVPGEGQRQAGRECDDRTDAEADRDQDHHGDRPGRGHRRQQVGAIGHRSRPGSG